ncbi:heme peroxidase [Mycolicibacterium sp. HK-90]|uniref:heme peroxidase n=1 Tax=Mycolicibacterium sp. HK-90 TaxID=3056937 RepID=UPI00265A2516|nr:heme peroxidase [Mycolicibacterium sp. HK-90]WKG06241.1 heme peroxidase [Mycolicibacterium sp. HK-90]
MHSDVEKLHAACVRDLGDPRRWFSPGGYPDSLALCVIDSIYSTGARYATVEKIIGRYRDYRVAQGADAASDGAPELLRTITELGGPDAWASQIGNRRPTSTAANAPLKSVAVAQVAQALVAVGVCSAEDLRSAAQDDDRRAAARTAWCAAPGQKSGTTWDYVLKLAQIPGERAGRVVAAYVSREIGPVSAEGAGEVLRGVAQSAGWNVLVLDHAIWRFESGRPYQRDLALSA